MNRSSSRGRLIETAFVSSTRSSTEDLDEVDRLANHPVLRSSSGCSGVLRKSRSEMGSRIRSGGIASTSWTFCPSRESNSPVSDIHRSPPPRRGMTRTITFHNNLSAVLTNPTNTISKSAPCTPPTRSVESSKAPPPSILIPPPEQQSPPNTAPLPNKFSRLLSSKSSGSTGGGSSESHLLRLPLSLTSRFRQRVLSKSASFESSSAESSPQRGIKPRLLLPSRRQIYNTHEDSSSSAMSSTESVVTDASETSESVLLHHHHSSRSNANKPLRKNTLHILSPISDKSQEQGDENDNHKTTANLNNQLLNDSLNNNNNNITNLDDESNVVVPWDMPKLRRRLLQKTSSSIQGSDSGISMTSQDLKDLLNVPWDMPKLRRKTSNLSDRPLSLPNDNTKNLNQSQPSTSNPSIPSLRRGEQEGINLNLLRPKGSLEKKTSEPSLCLEPPPGFEDEFYLTETTPQNLRKVHSSRECSSGRPRPKMTLSFGVDPSKKTLMFSTNSPFDLIDCDDVNPNIPLNRQDWYHGGISKEDAERTLKNLCEGSYLVRNLDYASSRQEYALSIKSSRGYIHMRIKRDSDSREFSLSDFPRKFITIPQMIHHYSLNRLPIKGAEHMCLKKPVSIQLL